MKMRTTMSSLEIFAFVLFIIYVVVPIQTPLFIANIVNSQIGLLMILVITVSLFIYTNPILGVMYIFVAYELLRRSSLVNTPSSPLVVHNSLSESDKQVLMTRLNPEKTVSLEESVISQMAPLQQFNTVEMDATFLPVSEKIKGSSMYNV